MRVGEPRPSSSLAINRLAEVLASPLMPGGPQGQEKGALCPESHTPSHRGSLYSSGEGHSLLPLWLGLPKPDLDDLLEGSPSTS